MATGSVDEFSPQIGQDQFYQWFFPIARLPEKTDCFWWIWPVFSDFYRTGRQQCWIRTDIVLSKRGNSREPAVANPCRQLWQTISKSVSTLS